MNVKTHLIGIAILMLSGVQAVAAGESDDWQKALRKECGADYANPKIGMTVKRADHCSPTFHFIRHSTTITAAGKIVTYRYGRYLVDTKDGVIVSATAFHRR